MKYYLVLIFISFLFASCFTINNIRKARSDRKPEIVDSILTSYKDDKGNLHIIYTKQKDKHIYGSVIPVDTIISRYRQAKTIDLINIDTTIKDHRGVFFTENINNQRGFQRLIYYSQEYTYPDTSDLSREIKNNEGVVDVIGDKMSIPLFESDTTIATKYISSKVVAFKLRSQNENTDSLKRKEMYVVVFEPRKKKYARYLLTPLTVGLDVVTLPGQIIYYGALLIIANTIKF